MSPILYISRDGLIPSYVTERSSIPEYVVNIKQQHKIFNSRCEHGRNKMFTVRATVFLTLLLFVKVHALISICRSSKRRPDIVLHGTWQQHVRRPHTAAKLGQTDSDDRISQAQRRKQSLEVGNDPLLSLNLNLDALARARAPERAQELYQRISALHKEGYYSAAPDIVSFNSVLKAWQTNPEKALEFWEAEAIPGRMNIISYNTFLLALARAGMYEQAESLLLQMQSNNAPVRPDLVSYNTVLLAYAVAIGENDNDVGHRADALIEKMLRGETSVTKASSNSIADDRLPLPPILDAYFIPPKPNEITFNTVISTWSEHPNFDEGAKKAEHWLTTMQNECAVRPDVYTYTTVMKALSRCRSQSIPSRVLNLLHQMQNEKDRQTRPNVLTYTTAIQALCCNRQIDTAYMLLDTMLHTPSLQPDMVTFTALFKGWAVYTETCARAGDTENVGRALVAIQKLYIQMKELSQIRSEATPDERTYTSILHAYAGSQHEHAGILARQILLEMSKSTTPPHTIHYNAALNCYSKSLSPNKVLDAAKLWKEMRDNGLKSCTITYNTIIYAAANIYWDTKSFEIRQKSYQIGQYAFDMLQNDAFSQATSTTYKFYFKMLQRLLHPKATVDRIGKYKSAFDLCCEQGCLDQIILDRILNSITKDEAEILFGNHYESRRDIRALPLDWSRNNKIGIRSE